MDTIGAVAAWAPHQARPGRRVLVVKDLADLRGPASGTVALPLRLYWSPPGRVFDLDDPFMLRSMYQDEEAGVPAAAGAVEAALRAAGLQTERQDQTAGLEDVFPGMGDGLAEWVITAPGGEQMCSA